VFARYDLQHRRLRYEVQDTGPGIPAERLSRLFLPFAQVDASTTRTFGGTGLGLSICRGLAEAMGGEIGVDSVLGEGSRFWVELPCDVSEQSAERRSALGAGEAVSALTGARVMVVDDNRANRELTRVICESFGMTVLDAADGAEAAVTAAREPLDAILLDVRMPGLSGPDTARLIRLEPGPNRSTPIIAFTAEVDRDHEAEWAGLFQGVLAKPMSAADVLAALAKVCGAPAHVGAATEPARIGQNLT
jgi:CheY-like chemotaxis protein